MVFVVCSVGSWYYSGWWGSLRALAYFQGSAISPGFYSKTLWMGIENLKDCSVVVITGGSQSRWPQIESYG